MRRLAVPLMTVVAFSLGLALAVFIAGSATAASSKGKTKTTKAKAPAATTATTEETTTTESPGDRFIVVNGTVNAASDHVIIGSSAFPNFTKGAVDNYYAMAHSHVDNSPFAQGTASPADTGPIGQTAAAGNSQQPQYADARWPGDSGKATYGSKGGPYATAEASEYHATADASEATNGLSGPGLNGTPTLALPKGFDAQLREALAAWKAKWDGPLNLTKPTPPGAPPIPKVPVPKAGVSTPTATVKTPSATVKTPVATVTTPTPNATGAGATPAPPVTVPVPSLPSAGAKGAPRSLAAVVTPPGLPSAGAKDSSQSSKSEDGESLLTSSTSATLVQTGTAKPETAKTETTKSKSTKSKSAKAKKAKKPAKLYTLVTKGESSLGRVTLGGGQIVIEGIHVTASISNDGTPTYKAAVSVASATIGGVPVTIDQDGVHVAGQGQGLPYQQASDALNGALKHAGIQLFLVGPEVKTCGQADTGTGTGGGTSTSSSDQSSGTTSSCDQQGTSTACDQTGPGAGLPPIAPPSSGDQSGTTSSCDQPGMCDQSGSAKGTSTGTTTTSSDKSGMTSSCDQSGTACGQAGTDTGGGTGAGGLPGIGTTTTTSTNSRTTTNSKTTTSSSKQQGGTGTTDTTTTSSWCDQSGAFPAPSSCGPTGKAKGTTTASNDQAATTDTTSTTMGSGDQFGLGAGASNAGEMTVTATGVHVVFTQPVNQAGVPAQYVEHILGEVFVDSLATPAGPLPDLGLAGSAFSASSACGGGHAGGAASSASAAGSSSAGGTGASGTASGSGYGSAQGTSGATGNSLPAAFAAALRKPLWLLLAYLVWQALVIGTGWSLWNWRRGGAT